LRWGREIQEAWLSKEDEARAARFIFDHDRETWRRGRAWIRKELGTLLRQDPRKLRLVLGEHGRPFVENAPAGFDANWSHSGTWIALATTLGTPATRLGLDLEEHRADVPMLELAENYFTPAEVAALRRLPETGTPATLTRRRLFFQLWTAKEALMKATGLGVALDPSTIDVQLTTDTHVPHGYHSHPEWRLTVHETL